MELLAASFGLSAAARESKATLLLELETLLRQRHEAGETTALIVDEAQRLPLGLLEEVRLLANIETDQEKLLSVILAGQPELAARLNHHSVRQLKQRVGLRCEIRALDLQETAGYLAGRIRAAGGVGAQVFTREAVSLIHERSGGVPRIINVLADNALLTGFALGLRPVGSQIVNDVCRDFDIGSTGGSETATPAEDGATGPRDDDGGLLSRRSPGEEPAAVAVSQVVNGDIETEPVAAVEPKRRRFSFFSYGR
jgi:general secretion pathway protein A